MDKLNVAIVGAGLIGEVHAKAYASHGRCELRWICDKNLKRARALARKYGGRATQNVAQLARDEELHAASVATPDFAHREAVMALLQSGKHVLCEKPLATKPHEARAMVRAARKRGLYLMIDFQNRWSPLFLEAKKEIDSGRFGEFACGYARLSNTLYVPTKMLAWASKTGPEWFLLPHVFDLVRWLTNRLPVVEVYAVGQKKILKARGIDAYDYVQTTVRFRGGASCVFENAWIMPDSWPSLIDFKMSLQGSKGKIELVGDDQGVRIAGRAYKTPFVLAAQDAFGRSTGFFAEPVLHFADSLLAGRKGECPGEDGLAATEVVAAAVKSIRTKRPVKLSGV